jgi:hypothetical protein
VSEEVPQEVSFLYPALWERLLKLEEREDAIHIAREAAIHAVEMFVELNTEKREPFTPRSMPE